MRGASFEACMESSTTHSETNPATDNHGTAWLVTGGDPGWLRAAEHACLIAGLRVERVAAGQSIEERLRREQPRAIVLSASDPAAEQVCFRVRGEPAAAGVAVLITSDDVSEIGFAEALSWGADDVIVSPHREGLVRRLRPLRRILPSKAPLRGSVIVVDPDARRRVMAARTLRNAGFSVIFAASTGEALAEAARPDIELIVAASAAEHHARALVAPLRAAGRSTPVVIAAPPRDLASLRATMASFDRVAVTDSFGSPENILFVANDLERHAAGESRMHTRALYGSAVRFRSAGAERDDMGYCFNVSEGGMYVRTLAPLPLGDEVWLELVPPRCDRRVRLEGRVAWVRRFEQCARATAPAGFGLQITGGSVADLERYQRGVAAFASEQQGRPDARSLDLAARLFEVSSAASP